RRTYVGSQPGRLIQGMKKAGSNNPVFMLDEIDKLGHDFCGDPAAALLEVLGYTRKEKLNISKQFLTPKLLEEHGLSKEKVIFEDAALAEIIDSYTREAGVRNLEREAANVIRAIAVLVAEGKAQGVEQVTAARIGDLLGPSKYISEVADSRRG